MMTSSIWGSTYVRLEWVEPYSWDFGFLSVDRNAPSFRIAMMSTMKGEKSNFQINANSKNPSWTPQLYQLTSAHTREQTGLHGYSYLAVKQPMLRPTEIYYTFTMCIGIKEIKLTAGKQSKHYCHRNSHIYSKKLLAREVLLSSDVVYLPQYG